MSIHSTAVVDSRALLGRGVTIGPFSTIEDGVEIGDHCVIGAHVTVLRHTALGEGCRIHAGAVLGDLPQDLGFKNDAATYVKIGKRCTIREHVTIHRGTKPGTATEVGDDCFLMAGAHLAHNVKLCDRVIIANGAMLGGYVQVGERTFISGNVGIHQFVKIGRLAMLGGNSGISKDVPPFCMVATVAFNRIAGLNTVGMRRAGLSPADRAVVKDAFRLLYRSGLNVTQAAERIKALGSPLALEFSAFIEQSSRGLCPFGEKDDANGDPIRRQCPEGE